MTFASGIWVMSIAACLTAVSFTGMTVMDLTSDTSFKIALHGDTLTPNFSATSTAWAGGAGAPNYEIIDESGSEWPTGGVLLSAAASGGTSTSPTVSDSTGTLVYDMDDVSVASTTLTNIRGCIIYADAITGPTGPPDYSDAQIVAVTFGSDYSTSGEGTFGIQWNASGVFAIDLTP